MRAASRRRSSKAEEEVDAEPSNDDDNAAGRRLGVDPRRRRSTRHPLGLYHAGEDHRAAVKLLERVRPDGTELARQLAKVLAVEDQAHHSADVLVASRLTSVLRCASRLVEHAELLLAASR
ncbi:hypothetical protein [Jiangella gansuensis]|uniref:hypothetical protein n=1 Tax=Jiangella gansuensis TaxID=281473 RepID=UPI0012F82205|nr:hypothetical protein [Jiangella gansuensis]